MKALLAEGSDVNAASERGQTPLMLAAVFGRYEIVSLLLAAGADVRRKDSLGLTATEWSVRRGFSNITQLLARASLPESPAKTRDLAGAIDPEANGESRFAARMPDPGSSEAGQYQHPSQMEIASNPDRARTGNNGRPKAGLVDVLRARAAAQIAEANTQAETLRRQAIIAPSEPDERGKAEKAGEGEGEKGRQGEGARSGASLNPFSVNSVSTDERGKGGSGEGRRSSAEPDWFSVDTLSPTPDKPAPTFAATAATRAHGSHERDATRLSSVEVPSFDQLAPNAAGRPMLWVMITVTLLGAAFATYRLTNHAYAPAPPPAAAVATTIEQPKVAVAKPLPVVSGALAGAELSVPEPEYPVAGTGHNHSERTSGTVTVLVRVNRKGRVVSTKVLNDEGPLVAASIKAARKATFDPDKFGAKSRVISGTITYTFAAPQTEPSTLTASPTASPAVTESPTTEESSAANLDEDLPVTGDALAGAEIKLPRAQYPESVKSRGISGTITVTVRVNRAGKVISWLTSSGDPRLRAAALKAAKRATFAPKKLPGKGEVVGTITYNFKP